MLTSIKVEDYMTKRMVTLKEDTDVIDAIKLMLNHKITCAPVLASNGDIVGMFSEKDSMKVVLETAYNKGVGGKVSDFMTKDVKTVSSDSSILDLAEKFQSSSVRSFPVWEDGNLVGIISRTDILKGLTSIK